MAGRPLFYVLIFLSSPLMLCLRKPFSSLKAFTFFLLSWGGLKALIFLSVGGEPCQGACLFIKGKGYPLKEAHTLYALKQGLGGIKNLGKEYGMIFIFPHSQRMSFWMRNTPLPLDIIFVDERKIIQHIHKRATPFSSSCIVSPCKVKWVIELKAGLADQFHLKEGDNVQFSFRNQACHRRAASTH